MFMIFVVKYRVLVHNRSEGLQILTYIFEKIGKIRPLATSELLYATPFSPIVSFPSLFSPVEILPYFRC
jgi:hypothetical protein